MRWAASRSSSPATAPAGRPRTRRRGGCPGAGSRVRAPVFSPPPRVGAPQSAPRSPVPLVQIEHRHDLIPHLPLPPSLARIVGHGLVDRLIDTVDWLAPSLGRYRMAGTEY